MFLDPVQPKPKIGHPRYKFGMNWVHEYFPKWIRRRPSMHRSQNTTEVRTWRYLFVLDRPKFTYFCIFHRITKLRRKDNVIQWLFRHLRRCIAQNPPMTCLPCAGNDLCMSTHHFRPVWRCYFLIFHDLWCRRFTPVNHGVIQPWLDGFWYFCLLFSHGTGDAWAFRPPFNRFGGSSDPVV